MGLSPEKLMLTTPRQPVIERSEDCSETDHSELTENCTSCMDHQSSQGATVTESSRKTVSTVEVSLLMRLPETSHYLENFLELLRSYALHTQSVSWNVYCCCLHDILSAAAVMQWNIQLVKMQQKKTF